MTDLATCPQCGADYNDEGICPHHREVVSLSFEADRIIKGDEFKKLRKSLGLKQSEMAAFFKLSQQDISILELEQEKDQTKIDEVELSIFKKLEIIIAFFMPINTEEEEGPEPLSKIYQALKSAHTRIEVLNKTRNDVMTERDMLRDALIKSLAETAVERADALIKALNEE